MFFFFSLKLESIICFDIFLFVPQYVHFTIFRLMFYQKWWVLWRIFHTDERSTLLVSGTSNQYQFNVQFSIVLSYILLKMLNFDDIIRVPKTYIFFFFLLKTLKTVSLAFKMEPPFPWHRIATQQSTTDNIERKNIHIFIYEMGY